MTFSTPTCAEPRAAPPLRTRATLGRATGLVAAGLSAALALAGRAGNERESARASACSNGKENRHDRMGPWLFLASPDVRHAPAFSAMKHCERAGIGAGIFCTRLV